MSQFRIKSISASNYFNDANKLTGTCILVHEGTSMEMSFKLTADDCTRIFAIVAGRVGELAQETAINVAKDLNIDVSNLLEASVERQQAQIEATKTSTRVEDAEIIEGDDGRSTEQPAPEVDEPEPFDNAVRDDEVPF